MDSNDTNHLSFNGASHLMNNSKCGDSILMNQYYAITVHKNTANRILDFLIRTNPLSQLFTPGYTRQKANRTPKKNEECTHDCVSA